MRFKLIIAYDGKEFFGFQKQTEGRSVQEELEKVLSTINKQPISVRGSGRTDRGVHALNQVVAFNSIVEMNEEQYLKALNSYLPKDIYVKKVVKVSDNFDPRQDAIKKTYIYKLNMGEYDVLMKDYVYQYNRELDVEKMRSAMKLFIGKHNFQNYCSNKEMYTYVREIYAFTLEENNDILTFRITGNGFMRYMVRYIVGTLIMIGKKVIDESFILKSLDTIEREVISYKAPSNGLYLESVEYGK
ncbi:MAG: tRNA pseudouridine(38-40) synthase TruA [Bacilli bacterium]|nr:tRNA pseudouridine(38-40) synthase TruA [Bacilli bacterium]